MKNSIENLMGGTWLLTFLQHQNALFYYQKAAKKPGRNPELLANCQKLRTLITELRKVTILAFEFCFSSHSTNNLLSFMDFLKNYKSTFFLDKISKFGFI